LLHTAWHVQKVLLEELTPTRGPLRSLRQLNWDVGPEGTLALMHEHMSQVAGTNVQMVPIFTPDNFQSAAGLAALVQTFVEEGKGMPRVEQAMLTVRWLLLTGAEKRTAGQPEQPAETMCTYSDSVGALR
jgi:hypothetical protein